VFHLRKNLSFAVIFGCCFYAQLFLTLPTISSTFYERIFCTKVLSYFHQSQTVTREKLPKRLSYKKGTCKILMKFTPSRQLVEFYEQILVQKCDARLFCTCSCIFFIKRRNRQKKLFVKCWWNLQLLFIKYFPEIQFPIKLGQILTLTL